ncbi:MAG: hypothetical protein JXQ26_04205 [Tissierellales bacterium]|nr:hypothetical protein [Tissierellales bacterium]MBN2827165.1 hypothetical protein [Tissierellales bacterium]
MLTLKKPFQSMRSRKSVRTYENVPLENEIVSQIIEYMEGLTCIFDGEVRFTAIQLNNLDGIKLGTYGVIKGAKIFIVAIAKKSPQDMEKLGYLLEKGILLATEQGLGTCWLGGTYKLNDFEGVVIKDSAEKIIAITPVGYSAEKSHFMDRTMRKLAGSDYRKPFDALFFNKAYGKPLTIGDFENEQSGEQYIQALEMIRIGPSASNKQPWRVIKNGQRLHFYLERTKRYPLQFQRIDLGIAIAHFDLATQELGLNGAWEFHNPGLEIPEYITYCASWNYSL